jgi:pectate lyase
MRLAVYLLLIAMSEAVGAADDIPRFYADLARETLAPNDGWASFGDGTPGGSAADPDHVFVVSDRNQLVAALTDATPKIIFISGVIYANVDDAGQPLSCDDYAAGTGYTLTGYLADPSGVMEKARNAAQANQARRIRIDIPGNTTIIGLADARIVGASIRVNNAQNVIIRNVRFVDAFDCFPQWDPTDGSTGNWNSEYDNISLTGATNVWVDHCEFSDGDHPDRTQPRYFGRPYQWHDGALDITNASDLVTVSWCHFLEHDKVMLIGSSDNARDDAGKLRVTLHHNFFEKNVQRTPRVRYGQVHVYNNYYLPDAANYGYSWGVGVESQIHAENNLFDTGGKIVPSRFISRLNGTNIYSEGVLMDDGSRPVDVVAAYNAAHNPDLVPSVSWTPAFFTEIQETGIAAAQVRENAHPIRAAGNDCPAFSLPTFARVPQFGQAKAPAPPFLCQHLQGLVAGVSACPNGVSYSAGGGSATTSVTGTSTVCK